MSRNPRTLSTVSARVARLVQICDNCKRLGLEGVFVRLARTPSGVSIDAQSEDFDVGEYPISGYNFITSDDDKDTLEEMERQMWAEMDKAAREV